MSRFAARGTYFGQLSTFGGLSFRVVGLLAAMSLVAGVLEGFVLVILVDAATGTLRNDEGGGVTIPIESLQSPQAAIVAALVVVALNVSAAYVAARASSGVTETVRDRVLGAYFAARWERQAEDSDGRLQEMVGALSQRTGNLTHASIIFLSSLIGAGALIVMAIAVDPLPALIIVSVGTLIAVALRPAARRTKPAARRMHAGSVELTEDVSHASQAAMEYAVFGVTDAAVNRLRETTSRVRRFHLTTRFWSRTSANAFKDAVIVAAAIAATIFAALSPDQLATVGAISLLLVRALGYAQMVQVAGQSIAEEGAALEITEQYVDSLNAAADAGRSQVPEPPPSISVRSVGFTYPGSGRAALTDVKFEVPAGAVAGIVGPSGAGKSTFIELLMGLREPTAGRIVVAGVEPHRALRVPWAQTVGYVPQRPRLFLGTVKENIRFYREWVSDDDIVFAAEQAHVADEIRASPQGFESAINTRGMGFSGGQAQRIALARALAGHPSILVLDEPTSALDAASEDRIATTLNELRGRVTILIVSHRPSTLANCDLFVSLDDGRATVHDSLPTGPTS